MTVPATMTPAERDALRDTVRRFLATEHTSGVLRRLIDSDAGFDPHIWQHACALGLAGLAVSEDHGGAGLGLAELAVVMEETGRSLACLPYLSSAVLAAGALGASRDAAAQARFLPQIAAGRRATLAGPVHGHTLPKAQRTAQGWRIDGQALFVLDGATSELMIVVANTEEGCSLFAAERETPGMTANPAPTLDLTRRMARLEFSGTPTQPVGAPGGAQAVIDAVMDRALVALAAEQLGGARACLAMSVDYASTRFQFGRQIGSFQSIKHKCAEMMLAVEMSAAALACAVDEEGGARFSAHASLAKAICSEVFARCATHNIQIHGGIGFTWEHDAHLYFRRAKATQALFGDTTFHRERYARLELDRETDR